MNLKKLLLTLAGVSTAAIPMIAIACEQPKSAKTDTSTDPKPKPGTRETTDPKPSKLSLLLTAVNNNLNDVNKVWFGRLSRFYDLYTLKQKVQKLTSDSDSQFDTYQSELTKISNLMQKVLKVSLLKYEIDLLKDRIKTFIKVPSSDIIDLTFGVKENKIESRDLKTEEAREKLTNLLNFFKGKDTPRYSTENIDDFSTKYTKYKQDLETAWYEFINQSEIKQLHYSWILNQLETKKFTSYNSAYKKYKDAFNALKANKSSYPLENATDTQVNELITKWNEVEKTLDDLKAKFTTLIDLNPGSYSALIVNNDDTLDNGVKRIHNLTTNYTNSRNKKGYSIRTINNEVKYYNEDLKEIQPLVLKAEFPKFKDGELTIEQKLKYLELQQLHNSILNEFFDFKEIKFQNSGRQYIVKNNINATYVVFIGKLIIALDYIVRNKMFDEELIALIKGDSEEGKTAKFNIRQKTPSFVSYNYIKNTINERLENEKDKINTSREA